MTPAVKRATQEVCCLLKKSPYIHSRLHVYNSLENLGFRGKTIHKAMTTLECQLLHHNIDYIDFLSFKYTGLPNNALDIILQELLKICEYLTTTGDIRKYHTLSYVLQDRAPHESFKFKETYTLNPGVDLTKTPEFLKEKLEKELEEVRQEEYDSECRAVLTDETYFVRWVKSHLYLWTYKNGDYNLYCRIYTNPTTVCVIRASKASYYYSKIEDDQENHAILRNHLRYRLLRDDLRRPVLMKGSLIRLLDNREVYIGRIIARYLRKIKYTSGTIKQHVEFTTRLRDTLAKRREHFRHMCRNEYWPDAVTEVRGWGIDYRGSFDCDIVKKHGRDHKWINGELVEYTVKTKEETKIVEERCEKTPVHPKTKVRISHEDRLVARAVRELGLI